MGPVKATLMITLTVTCPGCEHFFDLVSETDLNEEGWLLDQCLPEQTWSTAHENFECHVNCPRCSLTFDVAGVEW